MTKQMNIIKQSLKKAQDKYNFTENKSVKYLNNKIKIPRNS